VGVTMAILRERHLHMCSGRRNRCAVAALCVAAGWLGAHTVAFAGQQVQQQARHLHRSKVALEAKKSAYNFFVGHVLSHAAFKDAAAADGVRPMKMAGVIWRTLLPEEKEQFKQIELAEELVNDLLKRYHEQMASHSAPSPAPKKTVSRAPARKGISGAPGAQLSAYQSFMRDKLKDAAFHAAAAAEGMTAMRKANALWKTLSTKEKQRYPLMAREASPSSSSAALAPKKVSGTPAPKRTKGYQLFLKVMSTYEEFKAAHSQEERLSAAAEAWWQTSEEVKEEYERTAASLSEPVAPKPKQKRPLPPDSGSGSKPKKLNGYNLFIQDFRARFGGAGREFMKNAAERWREAPVSVREKYAAKAARLNAAAQEEADSR